MQTDKVPSRKAGTALSLVTSVGPREAAVAMKGQPDLDNPLSDPPVFDSPRMGKYAASAIPLERGLDNSAQYLCDVGLAFVVDALRQKSTG